MKFEPQNFFIGMMEFFSILLPGALLTYVLKADFYPGRGAMDGESWAIFFFSSYLLGHFIFLLGSILDDHVYDRLRQATKGQRIRRLAQGKKVPWRLTGYLASKLFRESDDDAVGHAARIRDESLDLAGTSSTINAFQWCKARLTLEHPEALATVQRFEADSKFFRSLLVVLAILMVWIAGAWSIRISRLGNPHKLVFESAQILTLLVVLIVLAFLRYVDQRRKATNQAYWYLIALEGRRREETQTQREPKARPSHAGGVVFRRPKDSGVTQVQFLLVQAKEKPKEWVLPKGHVEAGERLQETAVREVREETGVWGRIEREIGPFSYEVKGERVLLQVYLMEFEEQGVPLDKDRECKWLAFEEAHSLASHVETKGALKLANDMVLRSARK